jgi:hypothetical protein
VLLNEILRVCVSASVTREVQILRVLIATRILPKAGWNLVFMSCSRLGVEVNSPRCTAQNSPTTITFGACSTVSILLPPNELAQVIDGPEFSPQNSVFGIFAASLADRVTEECIKPRSCLYCL